MKKIVSSLPHSGSTSDFIHVGWPRCIVSQVFATGSLSSPPMVTFFLARDSMVLQSFQAVGPEDWGRALSLSRQSSRWPFCPSAFSC